MSEIDIQNAKQIRDPMDVLIEMELASDDVTLSYSGYSGSAKVADGELDESTWPMRKLADLQGDGFPLDGSCVLYDSSTSPSQTDGKLGVRGNVGEAVTITITGNKSIASLFIYATGAESVTFGGTTTPIYNNVVTIPVGATSITITLNPASETTRIEVSRIEVGAKFRITNENLIRATVSLRSDLSIIDPTLPESEINIEAYQDTDISEAVASIPEDTPIMYSAGYEGDMSPARRFYVTGQVTWADNVLTIQGVDGVHFLNKYTTPAVNIDPFVDATPGSEDSATTLNSVLNLIAFYIYDALGPSVVYDNGESAYITGGYKYPYSVSNNELKSSRLLIGRGHSYRDILAEAMNYFHYDNIPDSYILGSTPAVIERWRTFWPVFVDAGLPAFNIRKPQPKWQINEEDCGGVSRAFERKINKIEWKNARVLGSAVPRTSWDAMRVIEHGIIGQCNWEKNGNGSLSFDYDYVSIFEIGIPCSDLGLSKTYKIQPILPVTSDGSMFDDSSGLRAVYNDRGNTVKVGTNLIDSQALQGTVPHYEDDGSYIYTQLVPWGAYYDFNTSQQGISYEWDGTQATWNALVSRGYIEPDALQTTINIYGLALSVEETQTLYISPIGDGDAIAMEPKILGNAWLGTEWNQSTGEPDSYTQMYPEQTISNLFDRSNITGKFTWKGDPRMQPRDVVEWERLAGTTTTITLENITLTHEGGGTMAEITYREGVV